MTGTQGKFSAPDTGWTSAFRKVLFSLEEFQVNRLSGWKHCLWDFLHQRGRDRLISRLCEFYSHLLLKSKIRFLPAKGKTEQSSPHSSGLWQHLEVTAKPWQLKLMETVLSSLFHSSPAFKSQLSELYLKYMLFSILREAANQKTLFLLSDFFKKSVYFTLLSTGAREE